MSFLEQESDLVGNGSVAWEPHCLLQLGELLIPLLAYIGQPPSYLVKLCISIGCQEGQGNDFGFLDKKLFEVMWRISDGYKELVPASSVPVVCFV